MAREISARTKKTNKKTTTKKTTKKTVKKTTQVKNKVVQKAKKVKETSQKVSIDTDNNEKEIKTTARRAGIEDILFKVPHISDPLVGTPKEVQAELDQIAIGIKENPDSKKSEHDFNRIHVFMQGYLINVALKQFPYIKGYQTSDIYQLALIALRFKAIPNFQEGKGMSFLNFAKMCIRRHLITLLNASHVRQKDQSINRAISIDSCPLNNDGDNYQNTLANIIPDGKDPVDKQTEQAESYQVTRDTLLYVLSEFEQIVLKEYLTGASYREISINIANQFDKHRVTTKSVDNALLRIRKKATILMESGKIEEMPMFIV